MSGDAGDLANLADLALPPVVSFWPPAVGVWVVGATMVAALAVAGWRAWRRYRADAYLRRADAEVARATSIEQVSAVLKRAAMVAYGRERVASLTGASWGTFIRATTPAGTSIEPLASRLDAPYAAEGPVAGQGPSSPSAAARVWLRAQRGLVSERR